MSLSGRLLWSRAGSVVKGWHRPHSASFYPASVRCMGHGSHVSDNDPDLLEQEQKRNLKGETKSTVPHAPGWNEKLASDSEATVKADQEPDTSIAELQAASIAALSDPDSPAGKDKDNFTATRTTITSAETVASTTESIDESGINRETVAKTTSTTRQNEHISTAMGAGQG